MRGRKEDEKENRDSERKGARLEVTAAAGLSGVGVPWPSVRCTSPGASSSSPR